MSTAGLLDTTFGGNIVDELELAMRMLRERCSGGGGGPVDRLIGVENLIEGQDCTRTSLNYSRAQVIVNQLRNGSQQSEKKS